jgi:MFS family permease
MRRTIELLRAERRARIFFAVLTQSAWGTGAGYVALLLVAFERFESPWAISIVLIADLVAPMLLGPVFGAVADRWSRRMCAVVADVIRAGAFVGIVLVDGFVPTVALALLAGAGTALFTPATLAALPSLVARKRLPAATSLYGAISDFGLAAGPALAALVLVGGGTDLVLLVNGGTFALSAVVLSRLDFGRAPLESEEHAGPTSLLGDAMEGIRAARGIPGLGTVLLASAAALFFGGLVNVAELPFVTQDLGASDASFSAVVALAGVGIAAGSIAGSAGGSPSTLRGRYLVGLFVIGFGFFVSGLAPGIELLLVTFAVTGFGNGLMLVYERLIVQELVPDRLTARIFGVKDALTAWAFALSFLAAGGLVSVLGARAVVVAAGSGVLLVSLATAVKLRRADVYAAPASVSPEGDGRGPAVVIDRARVEV